jgi:hypothetical protein
MINALYLSHEIFNSELMYNERFIKCVELNPEYDPFQVIDSIADSIFEAGQDIVLHGPSKFREKGVNLIRSTEHDFIELLTNTALNGEIIHFVVVDGVFAMHFGKEIQNVLAKMFELQVVLNCPQNFGRIPIFVLCPQYLPQSAHTNALELIRNIGENRVYSLSHKRLIEDWNSNEVLGQIRSATLEYRNWILSDLESNGFVVRLVNGRFNISLSTIPSAGYYYNFKRFLKNAQRFILIEKEALLLREKIDAFERLLNDFLVRSEHPPVNEKDLQYFLTMNPEFILRTQFNQFWSLANMLHWDEGRIKRKEMDLIVKSNITNLAQIVELKRPDESILKKGAEELTRRILKHVEQVKEYQRIATSSEYVCNSYGIKELRAPCIFIGRDVPQPFKEINGVEIIGYDEVVEIQKSMR